MIFSDYISKKINCKMNKMGKRIGKKDQKRRAV